MPKKYLLALLISFPLLLKAQCGSVDFTGNNLSGCAPLSVLFTAKNVPAGAKIEWNLGGGFITGKDTAFRFFITPGKQTISLRITESGKTTACTTVVKTDYLDISPKPNIKLVATDTLLCNGSGSVTIIDSTKSVTSRQWVIDGQAQASTAASITKTFSPGSYSLSLKVTNSYGCTDLYKNNSYINVYNSESFEYCSNITQTQTQSTANFNIHYWRVDKSPTNYFWDFDGATPATSTTKLPKSVVFPDITKSYNVALTITFAGGCKYTFSKAGYITKYLKARKNDDTVCVNEPARIYNLAAGGGRQKLGLNYPGGMLKAGNTKDSSDIAWSTIGAKDLNYSFTYSVADEACPTNVTIKGLVYVDGPKANFVSFLRNVCKPDTLSLTSTSTLPKGGKNLYTWHIFYSDSTKVPGSPIGPSASLNTLKFYYPKEDAYNIKLEVTNTRNGCTDSLYQVNYFRVIKPKAKVETEDTLICVDDIFAMKDVSEPAASPSNPYKYYWYLQHVDSAKAKFTGLAQNFGFRVKVPGYYTLRHVVTSSVTCADTLDIDSFMQVRGVYAKVTGDTLVGCLPHKINLTTNLTYIFPPTTPSAIQYLWRLGPIQGGTIEDSTKANTSITLNKANCYGATMIIKDSVGCQKSLTVSGICVGNKANWGYDPDSLSAVCLGEPMQLYDSSQVSPKHYKWKIYPPGAGYFVPNDSDRIAKVVYTKSGNHKITLIVKGPFPSSCIDSFSLNTNVTAPEAKFSVDKNLALCAPSTITFTNQSKFAGYYQWIYGDGVKSNNRANNHIYIYTKNNINGFVPKLIAYKGALLNCPDTFELTSKIKIIGPSPDFSINEHRGCDTFTAQFSNLTTPISSSYIFDYGDGTIPDTNKIKNHLYKFNKIQSDDSVVYYPTLVASSFSCEAYIKDTIILYRSPDPGFSVDTTKGCNPLTVHFYNESVGKIYTTLWDLDGDGKIDTSNVDTATFVYSKAGFFSPSIQVNGFASCQDSIIKHNLIEIYQVPVANLTLSAHKGCDSLKVKFTSTNTKDSIIIDYGNGKTSTNKLDSQTYYFDSGNAVGDSSTYNIKFLVFSPGFSPCADTLTEKVVVYRVPKMDIVVDTSYGCTPLIVSFQVTTDGPVVNTNWDYEGDGIIDTMNVSSLKHKYSIPGFYSPKITATSSGSCPAGVSKSGFIKVFGYPTANLTLSNTKHCDSLTVFFKTNNINDSFVIDYGLGTPFFDTNKVAKTYYPFNSSIAIGDSNYYPIHFVVYNPLLPLCADSAFASVTIFRTPNISLDYDSTYGCIPLKVQYEVKTDGNLFNTTWDFDGNGTADTLGVLLSPYSYKTVGVFSPKFTANGVGNCKVEILKTDLIKTYGYPVPSLSLNKQLACDSLLVSFVTTNLKDSYLIDYGIGKMDTNSLMDQTYRFDVSNMVGDSSTYTVKFFVFNPDLAVCAGQLSKDVVIYRSPEAGFVLDTNKGCTPLKLKLTDTSKYGQVTIWDPENKGTYSDTGLVINHTYLAGNYGIKMRVKNKIGCADSVTSLNLIESYTLPIAKIGLSSNSVCNGAVFQLFDNSILDTSLHERLWSFGIKVSGDTLLIPNPEVKYTVEGDYQITLKVTDSTFCSSSDTTTITVVNSDPPKTPKIIGCTVANNKPVVIWEKSKDADFNEYRVYRFQSGTDTLEIGRTGNISDTTLMGPLDVQQTTAFAQFFLMKVVDTCGNISSFNNNEAAPPVIRVARKSQFDINVRWRNPKGDFTPVTYNIWRSTGDLSAFKIVKTGSASTIQTIDSVVSCFTKVYYYVEIIADNGVKMISNIDSSEVDKTIITNPIAIRSVQAINDSLQINWESSSQPDVKSYFLDRGDINGVWTLDYKSGNFEFVYDTAVNTAVDEFQYRIKSLDRCGNYTEVGTAMNNILLGLGNIQSEVLLTWNRHFGWKVPFHYEIQIKNGEESYQTIAKVDPTIQTYIDKNLYEGADTPWCYRILALADDPNNMDTSISNTVCTYVSNKIYYPNAFTPNDDGLNDVFTIAGSGLFDDAADFQMEIFDRWGGVVFITRDKMQYWDGKKNGELVPIGMYLYTLSGTTKSGEKIKLNGSVMVVK